LLRTFVAVVGRCSLWALKAPKELRERTYSEGARAAASSPSSAVGCAKNHSKQRLRKSDR
jgi:hypothetical protein